MTTLREMKKKLPLTVEDNTLTLTGFDSNGEAFSYSLDVYEEPYGELLESMKSDLSCFPGGFLPNMSRYEIEYCDERDSADFNRFVETGEVTESFEHTLKTAHSRKKVLEGWFRKAIGL